jgi:hypothetical protein
MSRILWILLLKKLWRRKGQITPRHFPRMTLMSTLRTLLRWAVLTSLLSAVLFLAAGSTRIPSLRDYVAVLSALLLFTMLSVDPELARERAHPAGGVSIRHLVTLADSCFS